MLASMVDLVAAACFRPYIMVPGAAKTHMQGRCKELPASVLTELDPFDVYVAMEDRHRLEELKGDSGNTKDTYSRHGGYKEIGYRAQHKEMLDDLEEAAETSTPQDQKAALAIVSGLLERNAISYGVMGGMNFYLRGSGRATGDVDIAVDNPPRMDSLLTIFNSHPNIYRPGNRMQWASGVARLFVSVQGRLVQVDLKPKGAEGHLIPSDLARAVDTLQLSTTTQCKVLSIGPLVAAKIKAHYNREINDDYRDLMFVCRSATYAPLVREAAGSFRAQWKESFLEKVIDNNPELERQVRWALNMDRSPSPKDKKSGGGGGGGGNYRGGRGGGGGSSRSSSPRDGDRSSDGYWTYSSRNKGWYHVHGDGRTSWRDQPSSSSQSKSSSSSTAQRSSDKTRSRDTGKSSAPRDGDKSKDGYWTYSSRNGKWYHRHSDGKVSYAS